METAVKLHQSSLTSIVIFIFLELVGLKVFCQWKRQCILWEPVCK